jgi:hypothetical protein
VAPTTSIAPPQPPRCGIHDFGCTPCSALNPTRATHGPNINDYGCTTRGSGALPAPLLASPLGCERATGTASTSAVTVGEGHISGTFDQSSSDDHTGEAGLSAFDRQTHPVGHLGTNLVAGTFLRPRRPCRSELASCHGRRVCCLDRQQHLGSCPLSCWLQHHH